MKRNAAAEARSELEGEPQRTPARLKPLTPATEGLRETRCLLQASCTW